MGPFSGFHCFIHFKIVNGCQVFQGVWHKVQFLHIYYPVTDPSLNLVIFVL